MEKVSVFIKIRVLFGPEISALGVIFNFDNERMRPPKYSSAPPGPNYSIRSLAFAPTGCLAILAEPPPDPKSLATFPHAPAMIRIQAVVGDS